jgi:hypothetical protein
MHRIDGAGHLGHLFVSEDPATSRPPTEITPEIMNAFQEELAGLIEWAGLALTKADNTQLKQALIAKFATVTDLADKLSILSKSSILQAQEGTNDSTWMTPAKVAAAIAALAAIADATMLVKGRVQLATHAMVQTGTNDTDAVTSAGLASVALGVKQVRRDETANRVIGGTYYNTRGRPIWLSLKFTSSNTSLVTHIDVDGFQVDWFAAGYAGSYSYTLHALVQAGESYSVSGGSPTLNSWIELG